MESSTGSWSVDRGSSSSPGRGRPSGRPIGSTERASRFYAELSIEFAAEVARLLVLGLLAVAWHAATRGRLRLAPGHQGLVWIALLTVGRLTSGYSWAGGIAALGAIGAALVPVWRLGDPFLAYTYLGAGLTLDVGYWLVGQRWRVRVWVLAFLGGLAHTTKPVLRIAITQISGWPYESLLAGLPYPAITHFLFGAAGAFVAAGLIHVSRNRRFS